ncbi:MAG: hypothetical protein EPO52_02525 [Herbiconiux sp.]|uniref:GAP family protein n=1 Tax=Herbiconiux sp. TaxID=1871186 RepID=UPI001206D908|nr:GAP family protein [Herbiconiux sp.]TAJ49834.1 MAG: hypothetical protein EPO52_02525 [Herbiconiux sp.]
MAAIIGHILPIAIGVALSSVPIIVMVLILLSPRGRWSSLTYLIGATIGLAGLTVLFTAVASLLPPAPESQQSPLVASIEVALGLALLVLAAVRWRRSRRRAERGATTAAPAAAATAGEHGSEPATRVISADGVALVLEADDFETSAPPAWMTRVTSLGPIPSFGVGFALMFRPKNLVLTIAAGVAIGAGSVTPTETVVAIIIFVVLGISTLAAPIIFALADPTRMRRPLEGARIWIERNSSTVTTVVLLMLGTVIVGSGLAHY